VSRTFATGIVFLAVLSLCVPLLAQSAPDQKPLAFEVASIRPAGDTDVPFSFRIEPNGTTTASGITLKRLLMTANNLQGFRILGGPAWVESQQWDVKAKHDGTASAEQVRQMLVQLVVTRFHLRTHRETRSLPAYQLVLDKRGSKVPMTKDSNAKPDVAVAPGSLQLTNATSATFASQLSYAVARPVIDRTNLTGRFDFSLVWTPFAGEDGGPTTSGLPPGVGDARPSTSEGASLFTALQEQLGLKLESAKGPVDVLVIDHVERPTSD